MTQSHADPGTLLEVVRGFGSVALVLGLVPFAGATLIWAASGALGLTETTAEAPAKWLMFALLGLTVLSSAVCAHRRGASAWAVLWGFAGGAATVLFFMAIGLALLSAGPSELGGCPDGKVYC